MRLQSCSSGLFVGPPSLERSLSLIGNDEMVEVTPKNLRIRKIEMNPTIRAREAKRARYAAAEAAHA